MSNKSAMKTASSSKRGKSKQSKRNSQKQQSNSVKANPSQYLNSQGNQYVTTVGKVMSTNNPRITPRSSGITVRHREFVKPIFGSVLYTQDQFAVNPGRFTSFPWLARIANNYETYVFHKLRYQFVTATGSSTIGTVSIGIDYDNTDALPVSEIELMNWEESVMGSAWQMLNHDSKPHNLHKQKSYYVRKNTVPAGSDPRLSDVGYCYVATEGMVGTARVGSLFVDYEVTLSTPDVSNLALGLSVSQVRTGNSNGAPFLTFIRGSDELCSYTSTGTITSVSTLTFNEPFEGVVCISVVGTGLGATSALGGTCIFGSVDGTVDAATTIFVQIIRVQAQYGQTLTITMTDTTITAGKMYIMQGDSFP